LRRLSIMHIDALCLIHKLRGVTQNMVPPGALLITKQYGRDPFLILVSCVLSLRTRDTVSVPASIRLFEHAKTPQELKKLSPECIQKLIYPVGFYRRKSVQLLAIAEILLDKFNGQVPCAEHNLLSLPGVGRKTMNLVLAEGFGMPALCVDTHVHRISNKLGIVHTKTPEETEFALKALLPPEYWMEYSRLLVMWGQNRCLPGISL